MVHGSSTPWHGRCELMLGPAALLRRGPRTFAVISLKTMLTVAAAGVVLSTPAFAQTGDAGGATGGPGGGMGTGGVGTGGTGVGPAVGAQGIGRPPGTTAPGGGLTPSTPPAMGAPLDPSASPAPPRPQQSTPTPGLDNPTGAIPGTLGSTPSGIGSSNPSSTNPSSTSGPITTPLPQGGTAPSPTPGSSAIQR